MAKREGRNREPGKFVRLLPLFQFDDLKRKQKLRRDDAEALHDFARACGRKDRDGVGAPFVAHGKQKPRKADDVVGMKMRKADQVDRLKRKARLPRGDLRALAAVDQNAAAAASKKKGRQPAPAQGHRAAAADDRRFQHGIVSLF